MTGGSDPSLARAWGEWIADLGEWHVFGALTYDQRRRETVPGSDVAKAHVRRWLRSMPKATGIEVEAAVVALEYQKNGWPHFHPLLRLAGGTQKGMLSRPGSVWYAAHGYAQLQVPRSRQDVCEYAAKYLAKDLSEGDVILWPPKSDLRQHQPALVS